MTVLIRMGKDTPHPVNDGGTLATVDPGNHGSLLIWHDAPILDDKWLDEPLGHPDLMLPISNALVGAAHLQETVRRRIHSIRTLVVEDQFVGVNANSALLTAFSAGVVAGLLIACTTVERVVLVKPATWQSPLPPEDGPRKGKAKRRAMLLASERIPDVLNAITTKPRRQGAADAFGMANWFVAGGVS